MGKYSSDSDSEKRSKSSYKSRTKHRSTSSSSSESRSKRRKHKTDRSRSSDKHSRSSGSSILHKSKSRRRSRSKERSRYRERHHRSRSKNKYRRSRSRSYIREYSSKSRRRSSSSSSSEVQHDGNADEGNKGEVKRSPEVTSIDVKVLNAINEEGFAPRAFTSSKSKKMMENIVIDLKKQTIKVPEVEPVEPDSIFHHNLFLNEEARMEKWIKELYGYRQRALQQGLKASEK